MKTFSRICFTLLFSGGWGAIPAPGTASETRVDATGGLTTVLTDETTDLNLFLDGNPAGLVLLNTRSRLDFSGQWSYSDQEGPWGSNKQQVFTTIPRPTDVPIKYEGLMLFPSPHWAFQVLGDFLATQGVQGILLDNKEVDTSTDIQYRGLVRAAYAFSFGSIGLEILNVESDEYIDPGLYDPYVGLLSGSSGQNQFLIKLGIATTFPNTTSLDEPRWQAGSFFTFQPGSSPLNQTLSVFYLNSPSFIVNKTNTNSYYYSGGADLLYEIPSRAKIRFSANIINSGFEFAQTVPFTSFDFNNVANHLSSEFQSMDLQGAFKVVQPISAEENLKLGGSVDLLFNYQDVLGPLGGVTSNSNRQQISTHFGIGLENPKEYTLGIQWRSQDYVKDNLSMASSSNANAVNTGFDLYQLAFGGEKWLSSTWALRMGLVLENDVFNGGSPSTLTTTLNGGVGLEQAFGRLDMRLWLGQTMDFNDSSNSVGLIGAQLSTTIFL